MCFDDADWALLSAPVADQTGASPPIDDLHFVYLDPVLQYHLEDQALSMVGTSFFDYVHPEEKERASDDMRKIVESRTLFGSVTRCRYSRLPRIREMLGATNAPRDPEAHKYVEDDNFVAIDIVINWIGDGMALCFFHAIIDKGSEDNDEASKSDWTNWCGTPGGAFNLKQCERMWTQVKANKREEIPLSGPQHVFQVLEAGENGQVLFSWPPPRLFQRDSDKSLIVQSDTTCFNDGSYFADDFARLAQGVSIAPGSSQLSDANTSCTRRFRAKHTLTTEGMVRSIESVLIPYGGIVLACFHTTFQQQLPRADLRLVEQAKASLKAARGQTRKAEESSEGPNKRARDASYHASNSQAVNGHAQPTQPGSQPPSDQTSAASQPQAPQEEQQQQPTSQPQSQPSQPPLNGTPTEPAQWNQGYNGLPLDPNLGSLNSLANASLGYPNGNGQADQPRRDAQGRLFDESNPPVSGLGGANDPGGSVATLAAVAAAAAAQTKSCTGCGKSNSPEWRRGPSGHKTLCNACGLRYARSLTRRKKKKGKDGEVEYIEPTGDPSVVPKSRGGGGGSLPGVHRKSSKKRKAEEEAKVTAAAAAAAAAAAIASEANAAQAPVVQPQQQEEAPSAVEATKVKVGTPPPAPIPEPVKVEEAPATAPEGDNVVSVAEASEPIISSAPAINIPATTAPGLPQVTFDALYGQFAQQLEQARSLSPEALQAAAQAAVADELANADQNSNSAPPTV